MNPIKTDGRAILFNAAFVICDLVKSSKNVEVNVPWWNLIPTLEATGFWLTSSKQKKLEYGI